MEKDHVLSINTINNLVNKVSNWKSLDYPNKPSLSGCYIGSLDNENVKIKIEGHFPKRFSVGIYYQGKLMDYYFSGKDEDVNLKEIFNKVDGKMYEEGKNKLEKLTNE